MLCYAKTFFTKLSAFVNHKSRRTRFIPFHTMTEVCRFCDDNWVRWGPNFLSKRNPTNVKYYVKSRSLSATDGGTHWNLLSEIPAYLWKYPSYAPVSQSSYTLRRTLAFSDSQYINIFTIRTLMIHCKFIHKTRSSW